MSEKKLLVSAYAKYADTLNIINNVTDGDYISVTEFSKLLSVILNTDKIKPHTINKLLVRSNLLVKITSNNIKNNLQAKYMPTNQAFSYCKKVYYNNTFFFIWNFSLLFGIFNINFKNTITEKDAIRICYAMKKYTHTTFDTKTVFISLIQLQIILKNECSLFDNNVIKKILRKSTI